MPYAGINILMLWSAAMEHGFGCPMWMTFRQAKELGAHVRKGEKGSPVVYANTITRTDETDEGETVEQHIPFMKAYSVFNVEQIEDLPAHYYTKPEPRADGPQRLNHAEAFFAGTRAHIVSGGTEASYNVALDRVRVPPIEAFRDAESFYATLAHEATHSTRHPDRLARDFGRKTFGDEGYAREELVAEFGRISSHLVRPAVQMGRVNPPDLFDSGQIHVNTLKHEVIQSVYDLPWARRSCAPIWT